MRNVFSTRPSVEGGATGIEETPDGAGRVTVVVEGLLVKDEVCGAGWSSEEGAEMKARELSMLAARTSKVG